MTAEIWLLAGFFAVVMAGVSVTGYLLVYRPAPASRQTAPPPGYARADETSFDSTQRLLLWALERMGGVVPASKSPNARLRRRLLAAGYRWPSAVTMFYGACAGSAIIAAVVTGWIAVMVRGDVSRSFLPALCGLGFGYLLPDRILSWLIQARARRLRRALPAALELLVLGLEAGQPLDQALQKTSLELRHAHPDMSAELAFVQLDMHLGKSRAEALRHLVDRNTEPEIHRLASLILENDRFGTNPAPALQQHAKYLRARIRQQAQEAARKVSVKLVFPVFFLIFPSLLVVTLGPAVIQMMHQLRELTGR